MKFLIYRILFKFCLKDFESNKLNVIHKSLNKKPLTFKSFNIFFYIFKFQHIKLIDKYKATMINLYRQIKAFPLSKSDSAYNFTFHFNQSTHKK